MPLDLADRSVREDTGHPNRSGPPSNKPNDSSGGPNAANMTTLPRAIFVSSNRLWLAGFDVDPVFAFARLR